MQEAVIDGKLFDISLDGMKLETSDKRIEALKAISISVDDFRVEMPCKKIWQEDCYYQNRIQKHESARICQFMNILSKIILRQHRTTCLNC